MGLVELILVLAIVGFCCWLVLQIPMPAPFPRIIIGFIVLFVVVWLLQSLGLVHGLGLRLR